MAELLGQHSAPVWGIRVKSPSVWATKFLVFSTIQGNTVTKPFQAKQLQSDVCIKSENPVRARLLLTKFEREKTIESSNVKACVSVH